MKLIINADDFGMSENVNNAILQSFKKNLISSTTIMVNMPGFKHACQIVKDHNLHGKVGLHLNFTEGYPLTKAMAKCNRFCDEGGKFISRRQTTFWLSKKERMILRYEIQAQIDRLISEGIIPTHIDSHHHYHTEWAIGKETMKVAKKNNIQAIRLTRNCGKGISIGKKIYKDIYNFTLMISGFAKVKYFGSIYDALAMDEESLRDLEIMVHPYCGEDGKLMDTSGEQLSILIQKIKSKIVGIDNLSSY